MKTISIALLAGMTVCAFVQPGSAAAATSYTEKVVWSFGNGTDGQSPLAGLIAVNGMLYGTTVTGGSGANAGGTVFSFDPGTGVETVLYTFCSQQNCTDGGDPEAGLIDVKGTLYGTTYGGGADGVGAAFSLDLATGAETVLHSFAGGSDGEAPVAGLIDVKGTLYGTTYGGDGSGGTVFSLDPGTGAETVLYSFCSQQNCTDGEAVAAGVINVKGVLYGTTSWGGAIIDGCDGFGCGVLFSLNPHTGAETVLHTFGGLGGYTPLAGLIEVKGKLYGTTESGGARNGGTVYSFDPKTGKEKVLHSFSGGADGASPYAGLIDVKGTLYGTTYNGGGTGCANLGCGTVFSIDPKTGTETILHFFTDGNDGAEPAAGLVAVNGSLYGTTFAGGGTGCEGRGCGTVFVLTTK